MSKGWSIFNLMQATLPLDLQFSEATMSLLTAVCSCWPLVSLSKRNLCKCWQRVEREPMKLEHADSCLSLPLHAPSFFFFPFVKIFGCCSVQRYKPHCALESCLNRLKNISQCVRWKINDSLKSKPEVIKRKRVWELEKGEKKKKIKGTYRWRYGVREYFWGGEMGGY